MNRFIRTAVVTVSLTMMSTAVFAQCMIYSEPNYKGAEGTIQPNDAVYFHSNATSGPIESEYRVFKDPSWLNNVNSSKVTGSCKLIIYEGATFPTTRSDYTGNTPQHKNNGAGTAVCHCK